MNFLIETSDSSRFYRPSSAAGTADVSTTSLPAQLSDINRMQPSFLVEYQKVDTVYLSESVDDVDFSGS